MLAFAALAVASPDPRDCRSQVLLGENQEHFYYLQVRSVSPASYYESTEIVTICKKRKADFALVEEHTVARRQHKRDPQSLVDTTTKEDVDVFDVQGYLAREDINFAQAGSVNNVVAVDSALYVTREARRVKLLNAEELLRQVKALGFRPTVVSQLWVYAPREWKIRYYYYLLQSADTRGDCSMQMDIVAIPQDKVEEAWKSLVRANR